MKPNDAQYFNVDTGKYFYVNNDVVYMWDDAWIRLELDICEFEALLHSGVVQPVYFGHTPDVLIIALTSLSIFATGLGALIYL